MNNKLKGIVQFSIQNDRKPNDLEYMIIDQASLTASIILLNENIKINTEQNIRRDFLSDVLDGTIEKEKLFKIAYYLDFSPTGSYWMLTMEKDVHKSEINQEMEVNEELVRHINLFFK